MQRATTSSTRRRVDIRTGWVLVVLFALFSALTASDTDDVAASPNDEAAFVTALDNVRARAGLPPFIVNPALSDLARAHAQEMADAGEIFHADPISAGYAGPWSKIGENVGVGADVSVLVDAFVASPGHYANIIDPAFTEIGVGVVWKGNALYTTHRFLQVTETGPPTTAPTITVPTTTTSAAPTITLPAIPLPVPLPAETDRPERLAPPAVTSDRIVTLLELLDQVGT